MNSHAIPRDIPPTRHAPRHTEELVPSQLKAVPEVDSRVGSVLEEDVGVGGEDSDDEVKMVFASDKENKGIVQLIKLAVQENQEKAERRKLEFKKRSAKIQKRLMGLERNRLRIGETIDDFMG